MASPNKLISTAQSQIGTTESGNNNVKYNTDLGLPDGNAWCAAFVCWCFKVAYGDEEAKKLLKGGYTQGSQLLAARFSPTTSPKVGDLAWRATDNQGHGHIGIICFVHNSEVTTIEGNSGNMVQQHTNAMTHWDKFCTVGFDSAYTGSSLVSTSTGAVSEDTAEQYISRTYSGTKTRTNIEYELEYTEVTGEVERELVKTTEADFSYAEGTNLLSTPTLVECPFVTVKIGDYTLGTYSEKNSGGVSKRTYPNYVNSIDVVKVNGTVNQYTIGLVYQIEAGDDPNLIEKILSSVGYGNIYISYGDWNSPSFAYKEEKALITNVKSSVDFSSSRISYTISATSDSLSLIGGYYDFAEVTAKPSTIIKQLLYDQSSTYGLLDVFTGMKNATTSVMDSFIPCDDKSVKIAAKNGIDVLSYLNYLVTCMESESDSSNTAIRNTVYKLSVNDDIYNKYGGTYFKITKVELGTSALSTSDTYVVDIGFPSDNLVTNFTISDDNSWSLLYDYSEQVSINSYSYGIDNKGKITKEYSPKATTSSATGTTTAVQKAWWTDMTQFPISATLTLKGLVRPAILMSYVHINALFYGQRHVSSGLYFITKQEDRIDGSGYRTILSLTRFAGDSDYTEKTKVTVTTKVPTGIKITRSEEEVSWSTTGTTSVTSTEDGVEHSYSSTSFNGTTYTMSDINWVKFTAALSTEQGFATSFSGSNYEDTLTALKWEACICLNRMEMLQSSYPHITDPVKFIRRQYHEKADGSGKVVAFFASNAAKAFDACPGLNVKFTCSIGNVYVNQDMVDAVKYVVSGGNRVTSANEQGCDFIKLSYGGQTIEGKSNVIASKSSRQELWVPNKTKLWAQSGSVSTFVGFPANNPKFDAFSKL